MLKVTKLEGVDILSPLWHEYRQVFTNKSDIAPFLETQDKVLIVTPSEVFEAVPA